MHGAIISSNSKRDRSAVLEHISSHAHTKGDHDSDAFKKSKKSEKEEQK
eukprot:SAG25_NODE_372_length_8977_cov_25.225839_2_plen_49_part_00